MGFCDGDMDRFDAIYGSPLGIGLDGPCGFSRNAIIKENPGPERLQRVILYVRGCVGACVRV